MTALTPKPKPTAQKPYKLHTKQVATALVTDGDLVHSGIEAFGSLVRSGLFLVFVKEPNSHLNCWEN